MNKSSFKIFVLSLIVALVIFSSAVAITLLTEKDNEINVKYVDNPIIFYTVESCVNKYVSLLIAKDSEAVYNVIDDDYKKENNITIYNALANNKSLDGNYSFVSQAMLEDVNEKYKYYVRGHLTEEYMLDDYSNKKIEYGIIVKLDVDNNTYSVILDEVGEYFDAV